MLIGQPLAVDGLLAVVLIEFGLGHALVLDEFDLGVDLDDLLFSGPLFLLNN